ncbi:hypothetical protein AXX17_AT4G24120 [Arabidopsis thaliana]|uniref:Uncharacterized protein n=1 Tax=Arabidopsis thaliana TaxID=3702 RepID=A0A178V094_ARATH|nr:hypothetical protein AXX17_AT4G24120 [Arabidopsis thaliana]
MEGDDESCVSMVGRWICYSNGWWDFKVDKTRPGKAINCEKIQTFKSLEQVLRRRFSMCTSLVYRSGVLFSCSHFVSRSSSARPSQVAHQLALLKKLISSPFLRNSLARSSSSSFSTRSLHQVPQLVFKLSSSSSSSPARLQALQLVLKLFRSPLSSSSYSARPQAPQLVFKLLSPSSSSSARLQAPQLVFKLFPSPRPSPRLAISSSLDCETHLPPRLAAGDSSKISLKTTNLRRTKVTTNGLHGAFDTDSSGSGSKTTTSIPGRASHSTSSSDIASCSPTSSFPWGLVIYLGF